MYISDPTFRKCKIESIDEVTHDTKLFKLQLPECTSGGVPIGHHVRLKANVQGLIQYNVFIKFK